MRAHYCKLRAFVVIKCTFEFSSVQKYVLVEMVVGILIGDKAAGHLQDITEEKEKKAK